MKYINFVKYGDPSRIDAARAAHFAYADRLRAQRHLAIGGALANDEGERVGLLFMYEAGSRSEALALVQADPFSLANALRSYELSEWRQRGSVCADLLVESSRATAQAGGATAVHRIFASYAKYDVDRSRLDAVRPAHWEYDRGLRKRGKLVMAGTLGDDDGGLFVYSTASRDQALACVEQDPFAVEGVIAHYELLEWLVFGVDRELLAASSTSDCNDDVMREPVAEGGALLHT
jgi:uncharacterized protein YciI